jgi:hypothetical protein
MCFVLLWWTRFLINAKLPWLFVCIIVALFCVNPNSLNNLQIHTIFSVAWQATMYSALVVDNATIGCRLLLQLIVAVPGRKTYPMGQNIIKGATKDVKYQILS